MTKGNFLSLGRKTFLILFILLAVVILVLSCYRDFVRRHLELPVGCDEFGYLYLAKAVSQGKLFSSPTERPFDPDLIQDLRASKSAFRSYMHMICPHAYHLDPFTNKIINQYPPGTSLLLSILPFDSAKRWGPAIFALFILIFIFLALALEEGRMSFFNIGLTILVMIMLLKISPFRSSFESINSLAPTYGLLIGAGYLLPKKPGLSLVFLGLASVFRVATVLFVLPVLVVYIMHASPVRPISRAGLERVFKGFFLFLISGLWIYLAYVWILLGNPFRPTYSFIDQAFTITDFLSNASYYFNLDQPWFLCHLVVLSLLTLAAIFGKRPWKWIFFSFFLTGINYLYYFVHKVQIGYYPYGSAMILLGLALSLAVPKIRKSRVAWAVPAAGAVFLVLSMTHKLPRQDFRLLFSNQIQLYADCFSKHDVVWAERRSGTIEYATGKAGFRYMWGPERVKRQIMRWLRDHGFKQAIWVSDLPVGQKSIEAFLKRFRLSYHIVACPELGTVIEIPPQEVSDE